VKALNELISPPRVQGGEPTITSKIKIKIRTVQDSPIKEDQNPQQKVTEITKGGQKYFPPPPPPIQVYKRPSVQGQRLQGFLNFASVQA